MKNMATIGLFGVIVATIVWSATQQKHSLAAENSKVVPQWEYAELCRSDRDGGVRLCLPVKTIKAKSFQEALQQLGKSATDDSDVAALNALGNDGWELIQFQHWDSYEVPRSGRWVFKRPK